VEDKMATVRRELDIEEWILKYMNSYYDSKMKSILQEKDFLGTLFIEKEKKLKKSLQENAKPSPVLS
jgi:hypothetical protein